ncbi:hypothetical protein HL653_10250 [Sphingomonas sp. AP4-R1]|nr:hypothetical protein HL653_10250 [Sphingomonas sp. AP4-R1]
MIILAATLSFGSAAAIAQTAPADPAAPAAPADATMPAAPADATAPAAPAATDPGMSSPAPSAMSATTATPPDTSSYPTCSRSVTDKCVQKAGGGAKKWKKKK